MSDPIPGNDPNAAYDVVPSQDWLQGWTVTCNGIPVRHFVNKTNADRRVLPSVRQDQKR
jgi:hypothetical protein